MEQRKKAIVIGAGFGGLSSAIRLQAKGFDVTLVEKREQVGGRAYQLKKEGYTFDMGPSLITAPFIIERLFSLAGKKLSDYVELESLDPYYRIYFSDGKYIDYNGNAENIKSQMACYSQRDADRYDAFFKDIKGVYDAIITDGLGAQPFMSWGSMLKFAPQAIKLKAFLPVYSFTAQYFKHEFHRFMFSFHPLFIGGSPWKAPSVYVMIPYLEKVGGVWFAKGGMYSLVKAMESVFKEIGGTVRTHTEVKKIVVEDGVARGIELENEVLKADCVVCNADIPIVYKNLIDSKWRKKWTDKRIDKIHMTMSCVLLYLGVKKQFPQLKHHTIVLGSEYKELVKDIFDRQIIPEEFSMYLHAPTKSDSNMAPKGCESLYVLIPVPNLKSGIDWKKEIEPFTNKVLDRLEEKMGMEGLKDNIEVMEVFTPDDFKNKLNSHLGNAFAIEPRLMQSAYFRPHNRSEDIERLYFVGAGTHPGGGVPGVLLSSEATDKCIVEDFNL